MIGITLGDPSGIGPEIVARSLAERPELARRVRVFGDPGVLQRAGLHTPVDIVEVTRLSVEDSHPGRPTPAGAAAQVAYLEAAVADRSLTALVTAPISKTQARAAGFDFPGHTEFLAERLGPRGQPCEHAMAFFGPTLRVVLATIHLPLAAVPVALTVEAIARAISLGGQALVHHLRIPRPRIGVLGLNPPAGEGGLFGREELEVIAPGIEAGRARLQAAGIPGAVVTGPLVPDAAYRPPRSGSTKPADLFVAMYHDQALIPVKLVDFEQAVNVTLGLPIVRTSPDHGVAYDIAQTGRARHGSFLAALDLAAKML